MLFASTWRFAFALGMNRMAEDLQTQPQKDSDGIASADDEADCYGYWGSTSSELWGRASAAALHLPSSSEGQHNPPCFEDRVSSPVGETIPPVPSAMLRTPVSPSGPEEEEEEMVGTREREVSRSRLHRSLPMAALCGVLAYHDGSKGPIALACAAAHPILRTAVETAGSLHMPLGTTSLRWPSASLGRADGALDREPHRLVVSPSLRGLAESARVSSWWWRRASCEGGVSSVPLKIEIPPRRQGQWGRSGEGGSASVSGPAHGNKGVPVSASLTSSRPITVVLTEALARITDAGRCHITSLSVQGDTNLPPSVLSKPSLSGLHSLQLTRNRTVERFGALSTLASLVELDLSYSSIAGVAEIVQSGRCLERITLKGCKAVRDLSALGELPQLREVVASQSGVEEVGGLGRSRSLISASFYGCLKLQDIGALGAVPTLRELYASESSVVVIHGLGRSRSLVHLGLRYCDLAGLDVLANIPTLRVLNVACTPVMSVAALSRAAALVHMDLASCPRLRDIGPLGAIRTLEEIHASGSDVASVNGLGRAERLRVLLLSNCLELRALPGLGACASLEVVELNSSGVADISGLSDAPSLVHLDVGFCKRLDDLSALWRLPALRTAKVEGSAGASVLRTEALKLARPHLNIDI